MQRSKIQLDQRFGRLVTQSRFTKRVGNKCRTFFVCLCDCGKGITVVADNLKSAHTQSCGCLRVDACRKVGSLSTHRASKTPEYNVHSSLVQRTTNPAHASFVTYGGNGRTVCQGLREFSDFISLIGKRPSAKYSIDRINNYGGYWCGNCPECLEKGRPLNIRWATREQQRQNMNDSRLVTINGQTHCIAEWERIAGLRTDRIRARIKAGWPINELLLQPPKYNSKSNSTTN